MFPALVKSSQVSLFDDADAVCAAERASIQKRSRTHSRAAEYEGTGSRQDRAAAAAATAK